MVRYRRLVTTNPVFITIVTNRRKRWLEGSETFDRFQESFKDALNHFGWRCLAWAMLPDHLHWLLDPIDKNGDNRSYSETVRRFKYSMTHAVNPASVESPLWQDRFFEHTIKNDADLQRHFDYIHFNPVKHRYVEHPSQWAYSSFHYYVRKGWYPDETEFNDPRLNAIPGARYDE